MGNTLALDRISERLHHRVLADQLAEGLRAVLARKDAVWRSRSRGRWHFRKVEPQSGRFVVVHNNGLGGEAYHCERWKPTTRHEIVVAASFRT